MSDHRTHSEHSAIDDDMQVERFDGAYRVMLDSPRRPRARQGTRDRAEREAARLAAAQPGGRFIILQEVGAVTAPATRDCSAGLPPAQPREQRRPGNAPTPPGAATLSITGRKSRP